MPRIFRAFLFFTFDYTFTESILYEIVNSIYIRINSNSAILGLCDINFEIFMGIFFNNVHAYSENFKKYTLPFPCSCVFIFHLENHEISVFIGKQ